MAKQKVSLEAMAMKATEQESASSQETQVETAPAVQTGQVVELRKTNTKQPEEGRGGRKDRPHTTLYLDKKVQKIIKEIALQYDRKPHDLYIEGINLMLQHYGRPSVKEIGG